MKKKYRIIFLSVFSATIIFSSLDKAIAIDPQLKGKYHSDIKVLEIDKGNVDKIWELRENPELADIIINKAERSYYESPQVEILDKWVQNGGCLWLKEPLPIAYDWRFFHKEGFRGRTINFENDESMLTILSHPIVEGIKVLSLSDVRAIEPNFSDKADVILQYEGIPCCSTNSFTRVTCIIPFGTSGFESCSKKQANYKPWKGIKFQPQIFPVLVVKSHGKGKVLFGDFVVRAEYDWERFELNIKEWGAGYQVPEDIGNHSSSKTELNVNHNKKIIRVNLGEDVTTIGNLKIVSFDPTEKAESIAHKQAKLAAHKLAKLFVQRQIGKVISYSAGNIASKVLSPVTTLISQMPSVGNPTEIECYFIAREDVVKKGEVNIGEPFGLLVYISQGDLLKDLTIELKKDLQIVYSEDVSASFLSEHYGRILLIASYPPLSMSESGTYRLTAIYGEPKSSALLQIKQL